MKKLKGNSVLALFVFSVSLLMLCVFGTDTCFIILSRYKLQKITDSLALEFASSRARDADYTAGTERDPQDVVEKYRRIYNIAGSGLLVFQVTGLKYKSDRERMETVVEVSTTSRVLPIFLRFVGVTDILVHSNARAKTRRITVPHRILKNDAPLDFALGDFMIGTPDTTMTSFVTPFSDNEEDRTGTISAKNTGYGDFMIDFAYDNTENPTIPRGGGFFITGGFETPPVAGAAPEARWSDISTSALNKTASDLTKVCTNATGGEGEAQCLYCINATDENGRVIFDLNHRIEGVEDTGGYLNRLTHIEIYKAANKGVDEDTGATLNPCDPNFVSPEGMEVTSYNYINREIDVTLTILNDVSLITKREYRDFEPRAAAGDTDIMGEVVINEE